MVQYSESHGLCRSIQFLFDGTPRVGNMVHSIPPCIFFPHFHSTVVNWVPRNGDEREAFGSGRSSRNFRNGNLGKGS